MRPGDWPVGVVAVVKGNPAADAAYIVVDRDLLTLLDPPRACGDGWWLIEGMVTMQAVAALEEHLSGQVPAVIFVGDDEPGYVECFESGRPSVSASFGFPDAPVLSTPPPEASPQVTDWLRRYAPKRCSPSTIAKLWTSTRGSATQTVAARLLNGLGWNYQGLDVTSLLDGCDYVLDLQLGWIAETRVDWTRCRWVLGGAKSYIGMWDLDAPGEAVERWPKTSEGTRQALARQFDLVARPILTRTRLPGDRRWARIAEPVGNAHGVFFHFSPQKQIHVFWATDPEPLTYQRSEIGYARLPHESAATVGLFPAVEFDSVNLPLENIDAAERAASAMTASRVTWTPKNSSWRPIPESVPRTFLDTGRWVRHQAEH